MMKYLNVLFETFCLFSYVTCTASVSTARTLPYVCFVDSCTICGLYCFLLSAGHAYGVVWVAGTGNKV